MNLKQIENFLQNLFSTQKPQQETQVSFDKKQHLINALRQNTIDQTAYTPQAIARIKSLTIRPANYSMEPGTLAQYNQGRDVSIGSTLFRMPSAPLVLRHEINHSMDANINAIPYANYNNKNGSTLANSYGFYPTQQQVDVRNRGLMNQFLSSYSNSPQIKDIEAFAERGNVGQNIFKSNPAVADYYRNIYIPMSKAINYSPLFPIYERQK